MHSEKAEPWESPAWGKLRERLCLSTRPWAEPWMWSCKENGNQVEEGGDQGQTIAVVMAKAMVAQAAGWP